MKQSFTYFMWGAPNCMFKVYYNVGGLGVLPQENSDFELMSGAF